MLGKIKNSNKGAIALLLVIMITALTVISAVAVSMTNISDLMASYYSSEAEEADVDIDACLEDALLRLSSTTAASGTYYLTGVNINCYYDMSSTISGGLKTVTTTASSTSSIGYWEDTIVMQVNVSTTPVSVYSYKTSNISYASFLYCGDGECNNGETTGSCSDDCAASQVCGNSIVEGTETCDDGGVVESCGDGVKQNGQYCNSNCDGYDTLSEACDYTQPPNEVSPGCFQTQVGCPSGGRINYSSCSNSCGTCGFQCIAF